MHMDFNSPYKLGPKDGLHIIHQCILQWNFCGQTHMKVSTLAKSEVQEELCYKWV